jgi:cell division protein FtsB
MTMRIVRLFGRLSVAAFALLIATLVSIQFEQIVARNVSLQRTVNSTRADIGVLREQASKKRAQIERLSDPEGVVPEIHDRLHLVSPHEELIYVKGLPTAAPSAPER